MAGTTISNAYFSSVTLSNAATQNPATIADTGRISASGTALIGEAGTAWTVTNYGIVQGTGAGGTGIALASGGTVDNLAGTITGATYGVDLTGGTGVVTNASSISGGTIGIKLGDGGSVINLTSSSIYGFVRAIVAYDAATTVINSGSISSGTTHAAIVLDGGGRVTNAANAVINSADGTGLYATNTSVALINAGTLIGGGTGVALHVGGYVSNALGGTIVGSVYDAIYIEHAAGTVFNAGLITSPGTDGNGIAMQLGGYVSNAASGVIFGAHYAAIFMAGAIGTVENAGLISSSKSDGIALADGGRVSNQGTIGGDGFFGVVINELLGTVANSGSISGQSGGVVLTAGGLVTNSAGHTISSSDGATVFIGGGAGTVVDAGAILGGSSITNAVEFTAGYADRMVIDPGAVFYGRVSGGNTLGAAAVSTLELASGASAGVLSGLGSEYVDFSQVTIDLGATWTLTNTSSLAAGTTLTDSGTLVVSGSLGNVDIAFADGGALVKFDDPEAFDGSITDFVLGDTIDLGPVNVSTLIYDGGGDLIAIGSSGTVFDAPVPGSNEIGTFVLSGTGGVAGNFQVTEGGGGDTDITVLSSTWLWQNGASAPGNTPADWSAISGPGNGHGYPQDGDTAIDAGGTILLDGLNLESNTLELGGTASVAALTIIGGSSTNIDKPSLDSNSVITSDVTSVGTFVGNSTPETSLLNTQGIFINDGTIDADGPAGSNFTIAVSGTTIAGTFQPGEFINYNLIEVDAGNAMTITVAGTSELFNVGEIVVNGGSLLFNAATDAIVGGYAPGSAVVLIENGGTVETNVGYASNVNGDIPTYAFGLDTAVAGNTLKIDNIGSFGGAILGFGPNDTIDLGISVDVTAIAYNSSTGILSLDSGGTVAASLLLASGNFRNYSGTVTGGTADGFVFSTGADGNTVVTTSVPNDIYDNASGTWQTSGLWSNGTPGTLDTAVIGLGANAPFTLTTGASPVSAGALVLAGSDALLQITSDTTVSPYTIRDYGGTLEVTGGNTLTAANMAVNGGETTIDPAAVLDLTGHDTYGGTGAVDDTISAGSDNTQALRIESGSFLVNGGTLDAGPDQSGGTGGRIYVGFEGGGTPATMTVQSSGTNAAVVTDTYALLASDPTSFGVLTLDGNVSWTDEIVPGDTQSNRGYMTVGFNNQATISGTLTPAFSGAATLVVENGATLTEQSYAQIADTVDSAGSVLVSDALWNIGTASTGGFLDVGRLGDGVLTVAQDGIVQVGGSLEGFINNGTSLSASGINVGVSAGAVGTLDIESGGTVAMLGDSGFSAGLSADATGLIIVNGPGALLNEGTAGNGIGVGNAGTGTLEIEGGSTVDLNGTADTSGIGIGQTLGATGLVVVSGSGSLLDLNTPTGSVHVGDAGQGTLEVQSGGTVAATATGVVIGLDSGGGGTVTVSGAGSELLSIGTSGGMIVGDAGAGILTISNGASAVTGARVLIANGSTATGTATVDGGTLTVGGSLVVGDLGSGALTVENGGLVNTGTHAIDIGDTSGSSGFVDINTGNALLEGGSLSVGNATAHGTLEIATGGTAAVTTAAIGQDGSVILAGGVLDPLTITLNAGGAISGFGTMDGNLANASTVTATGGALTVIGEVSGSGTMDIAAGATLALPGIVLSGQVVDFTADTGVLQLGMLGAIAFNGTIGFGGEGDIQPGDTIILNGVTADTDSLLAGNTLQVDGSNAVLIDLKLDPAQVFPFGNPFHVTTVDGNAVITDVPCYLIGTRIRTSRGEVRVETLKIGDRVVTLDGSKKPIKWIGRRSYSGAIPAGLRDVIPIVIKKGALGPKLPKRDLIVSPLHALYLDGVLVPAEHLVNGTTILRAPDIDPIRYFHIELDQHDVIYADGAPAETFVDCDSRSMFHNAPEFDSLYPGDATPRWQYCAPRVEGGERLAAIKRAIDRRAGIALPEPGVSPGRLEGRLDGVEGGRISGWAFHPDRPVEPVWLEVLDGDGLIARVHARRYRADLEAAGVGDGRHGFELHLTGQMRTRREIRVRRVEDGVELDGSPLVVEARGDAVLLEDARRVIAAAILDPSDTVALDALATELLHGVDALRQARARLTAVAGNEPTLQSSTSRAADQGLGSAGRAMTTGAPGLGMKRHARLQRALIIDAQLPRLEHDAGSQAILSHAAALTALGFQVEFVAAHELARADQASEALEHAGYVVHQAPRVASVEEVLRRHRNAFDVVYLHRLATAEAYTSLARAWQARARLVYSVADLHHVRLARQAAVQGSAEMADAARAMRVRELNTMRLCDAVITHSTAEAAYLAQVAPGASVHVVAWTPGARPQPVPPAARQGVGAIGSWSHEPNVDAVRWLVSDIMPRVWALAPDIELLVVGSDWPARVPWITDQRVRLVGAVTSIETLLATLRASVAPLRFGAGLKGKVLDSFACEVPCVMTPVAAEGFALAGVLPELVAEDSGKLASLIVRLHQDAPFHRAAVEDGLALAAKFSPDTILAAMAAAVGVPTGSGAQASRAGARPQVPEAAAALLRV